MRIGFVSSIGAGKDTPAADFTRLVNKLTREQISSSKEKGTEVAFLTPESTASLAPDAYSYLKLLGDVETLYGYMELAKTGEYDAVIGFCFLDPMKREARQALDIPFVGIAETAMHMACMMGAKFGVVAPNDPVGRDTTDAYIRTLGLQDRAVPTRMLPLKDEWAALQDAHEGIEAMKKVSRELIADGAEVIIPGCVLADVMAATVPGCKDEYPDGLREIDGVPVLDVASCAVKFAEILVDLKKAGVPWISRKGSYNSAKDNREVMEQAASVLAYRGPGFWLD